VSPFVDESPLVVEDPYSEARRLWQKEVKL
jgi:hypothetical protein